MTPFSQWIYMIIEKTQLNTNVYGKRKQIVVGVYHFSKMLFSFIYARYVHCTRDLIQSEKVGPNANISMIVNKTYHVVKSRH